MWTGVLRDSRPTKLTLEIRPIRVYGPSRRRCFVTLRNESSLARTLLYEQQRPGQVRFGSTVSAGPVTNTRHCRRRRRKPVARNALRSIAARTDAPDPTTRTLAFARVTAV
jgi:hypothetical protein